MGKSRNRITLVCTECKRLKSKCDRQRPCSACRKRKSHRACRYHDLDEDNNISLKEVLDRLLAGANSTTLTDVVKPQTQQPVQVPIKEQDPVLALIARLPLDEHAEEALKLFKTHRNSLNYNVHWPSFTERYQRMLTDGTASSSFVGLVAAVMASGKQVLSQTTRSVAQRQKYIQCALNLYQISVNALELTDASDVPYDLDYLRAGTLQCEFSLHCHDRNPIERRTWPRLGSLITIAMQLGLHRDPEIFDSFSPFEREMRRRMWWNIYICDQSLSAKLSYPPHINDRECSCRLPVNAEESVIHPDATEIENSPHLTEKWFLLFQCHTARLRGAIRDAELSESLLSKETVEELEASCRLLLSTVPSSEEFGPKMETHRYLAHICIHSKIIRLYNHFIHDPNHPYYGKALRTTLTSCHVIIESSQHVVDINQLDPMSTFVPDFWYTPDCFTAGAIVGACLVQNRNIVSLNTSKKDLFTAVTIFQKLNSAVGKEGESESVLKMFYEAISNCSKITSDNRLTVGRDRFIIPPDINAYDASLLPNICLLNPSEAIKLETIVKQQQQLQDYPSKVQLLDEINIGISREALESAIFEFSYFGANDH
ncbi:fungal-specific transcription factor domain-containing protein [Umbelopsis sp. AD052]|nr:fungal-specific transcription factor domain-containing protein [Umbelopsis sp. AD052]